MHSPCNVIEPSPGTTRAQSYNFSQFLSEEIWAGLRQSRRSASHLELRQCEHVCHERSQPGGHAAAEAGMAQCPDAPTVTIVVVGCAAPASAPPAVENVELPTPDPVRFGGDAERAKLERFRRELEALGGTASGAAGG